MERLHHIANNVMHSLPGAWLAEMKGQNVIDVGSIISLQQLEME